MPATVTLSSTTLGKTVGPSERSVQVGSTSGLSSAVWLYCDGELMSVVRLGVGSEVFVRRGVGGTLASTHEATSPIYIGRPDQFFTYDPKGKPPDAVLVSPWINVANGSVWFAEGGATSRRWTKQTAEPVDGPLGIYSTTYTPTSST